MIIPDLTRMNAQAVILAVLFSAFTWLFVARSNLKVELAQVKADYVLCKNANAEWLTKTEQANRAINDLRVEAEERLVKAHEAQEKAARIAQRHMANAQAVLAVRGSGKDCRDAENLVRQYLRGRK